MRAVNLLPKDDGRQRGPSFRDNPLVIGGVVGIRVDDGPPRRDVPVREHGRRRQPEAPRRRRGRARRNPGPAAGRSRSLGARAGEERAHRRSRPRLPDGSPGIACSVKFRSSCPTTSGSRASRRRHRSARLRLPAAGFSINGQTYSHDGVARLLARLRSCRTCRTSSSSTALSRSARPGARWSSSRSSPP